MHEFKMGHVQAVIFSVSTRTRPIFMTTLTTVLGMMPLVFPNPSFENGQIIWTAGAGSELYRGMGSVILGGLSLSTLFTLVLIPIGFTLAMDIKRLVAGAGARAATEAQPTISRDLPAASPAATYAPQYPETQ